MLKDNSLLFLAKYLSVCFVVISIAFVVAKSSDSLLPFFINLVSESQQVDRKD